MIGEPEDIAETLLSCYDLEDILEMNELTPQDVLSILIQKGLIDTYNLDIGLSSEIDE